MITLILAGWVVLGALLFYRLEARVAILANFLGGWAVLPGASYKPAAAAFPYWFMGVCLPSDYLFTKALAIGLAALAGVLLFHARDLRRFRAELCDVPMAVWCAVPLVSALVHGEVTRDAVSDAGYLAVVWGVPWILGRIYFADVRGLVLAARAIVWAGLCYMPICVVEVMTGPQLYAAVYGYEPYRWVGATRYFGYRPIGMLEDGNQLGIWMCSAALLAVALLLNGIHLFPKRANLWMAGGLGACAVLCQSAGSILLLAVLLPLTLIRKRQALRAMLVGCLGAILIFAAVTMTGIVPLRALASRSSTAQLVARDLAQVGRQSFAWRLGREETYSRLALSKPLVGNGHWNWWQNGEVRPWGLWMLVLGMYGVVGLGALVSILLGPVVRAMGAVEDAESGRLRVVMGAVLLMSAIDSMMNGDLIVPYVVMMGALATPVRGLEFGSSSGVLRRE